MNEKEFLKFREWIKDNLDYAREFADMANSVNDLMSREYWFGQVNLLNDILYKLDKIEDKHNE